MKKNKRYTPPNQIKSDDKVGTHYENERAEFWWDVPEYTGNQECPISAPHSRNVQAKSLFEPSDIYN